MIALCTVSLYTVHIVALITIDPDSPVPAVRQIIDALRVELVEGRLKPGDEMPSVRRAAIDLGLHFNTVAEAYRQLADEGWLQLRHGRSARVADRQSPKATRQTVQGYRQRLRELVSQMRAAGMPEESIASELQHLLKGTRS
jgi:GntR family transcriptional regulator